MKVRMWLLVEFELAHGYRRPDIPEHVAAAIEASDAALTIGYHLGVPVRIRLPTEQDFAQSQRHEA